MGVLSFFFSCQENRPLSVKTKKYISSSSLYSKQVHFFLSRLLLAKPLPSISPQDRSTPSLSHSLQHMRLLTCMSTSLCSHQPWSPIITMYRQFPQFVPWTSGGRVIRSTFFARAVFSGSSPPKRSLRMGGWALFLSSFFHSLYDFISVPVCETVVHIPFGSGF